MLNPLGAVLLEMDPGPGKRCDHRFLRARIGICERDLLPPKHWMLHRDASGYVSSFDIFFDIETEKPLGAGGRGNGGSGSEKGQGGRKPPPGITQHASGDTAKTAAPPSSGGNGELPMDEDATHGARGVTRQSKPPCQSDQEVKDTGKAPAPPQRCNSEDPILEDSDSSDDEGLRAHFQQYYGGGAMTKPASNPVQATECSSGPKDQAVDSDSTTSPDQVRSPQRSCSLTKNGRQVGGELSSHHQSAQRSSRGTQVGPTGTKRGLSSTSPRLPTTRPPSPTGASPAKPITISDSSSDQQLHTPTITHETSSRRFPITRKSLRIQAQGGPVSILSRAQKRAREKGEGSSSNSGLVKRSTREMIPLWLPDDIEPIPLQVWDPEGNLQLWKQEERSLVISQPHGANIASSSAA